ncbi:ankyrin repeat domain-containing protein [Gordonia sp. PKS22-38]|uniref:Ankyrin repeat domain-containing protein n=1 Tax=Gordonia prachuapensis TaxID=3115651 RepID=A0ABU7MUG4_9ACTN|nr:ankyrin repeat domain-containing protein [Gordonia sp. PKS22-38]
MSSEHPIPDQPDTDGPIPDEVADLAGRLFDMARAGDTPTLAAYLDAGVPVGLRNQSGDSLLMLAAYHGSAATVAALVERGADVDAANDKGQTPLAGAVFKGHDDVVEALVRAGADPHAGTPTADDAARMFGREDYAQLWRSGLQ